MSPREGYLKGIPWRCLGGVSRRAYFGGVLLEDIPGRVSPGGFTYMEFPGRGRLQGLLERSTIGSMIEGVSRRGPLGVQLTGFPGGRY